MQFKNLTLVTPILFLCFLMFSSCQKDIFKSDTELITNGSWRIATIISEPPFALSDGTLVTDVQTLETDCAKDDTRNFTEEGTYYISDESVACSWYDPEFSTGEWRFNTVDGEKRIEYNFNSTSGVIESYKLRSLNSEQMVLVFKRASGRIETMTYDNISN